MFGIKSKEEKLIESLSKKVKEIDKKISKDQIEKITKLSIKYEILLSYGVDSFKSLISILVVLEEYGIIDIKIGKNEK